jgi:NAD(P)-dependent dehydrogenase (short-subunit alcohol dehydrogenase family)
LERTCLVTGATNGIGRETARALAARGFTVAIVARDRERGLATRDALRAETGNPHVEVHLADLSRQADVRALAAEVLATYPRLHVLVNNAGAVYARRELTDDGIERTLAVNHVAPFLLTQLLLPRLEASPAARVVNVNSKVHEQGRLDPADLQPARGYHAMRAYGSAKLANLLWSYEQARRTAVAVNAVHPGLVATNIGHNAFGFLAYLTHPFSLTVEEGARTPIYLATDPAVEGVTGRYFVKGQPARSSPASYDQELAKRLWDATEALLR